jgi:protein-tyrosine phosphatase
VSGCVCEKLNHTTSSLINHDSSNIKMKGINILHFFVLLLIAYYSLLMKILVVCLGNICRSPLGEGILKSKLPENFVVDSVGTISMHEGKKPDERSIETAKNHGIDISKQRSRPIKKADLENFDHIYCMDLSVYEDVISMAKNEEQRKKISLFLEAAGNNGENNEVPDPYWGNLADFENVYQMIDEASSKIAQKLVN